MRGGLVHHIIKIPAALSLLLLRLGGAAVVLQHLQQYLKMTGFVPESPIFSNLQFFRLLGTGEKENVIKNRRLDFIYG